MRCRTAAPGRCPRAVSPSNATLDSDNDGANNLGEYIADTDPTDSNSFFMVFSNRIESNVLFATFGPISSNRFYRLECRTSVVANVWFTEVAFSSPVSMAQTSIVHQLDDTFHECRARVLLQP